METHVVPYASGLRTFVHGCSVPCMFLHGHVCSILGCGDFGTLLSVPAGDWFAMWMTWPRSKHGCVRGVLSWKAKARPIHVGHQNKNFRDLPKTLKVKNVWGTLLGFHLKIPPIAFAHRLGTATFFSAPRSLVAGCGRGNGGEAALRGLGPRTLYLHLHVHKRGCN